ncbi:GNAT family N-acetyltransferase [Streptomyces sp. NBC_01601]|uniref:GNAT family N-acetyltransferase n=1 Tax=Streptomyces sp. NBC_01601 TaxID=2975892 RepID=UPI002E2E2536|nr:GNAT family N-acetyltransferase [Streptomyces sp. NBC_01601]
MPVSRITHVRSLEGEAAAAWINRWWPVLYDAAPHASAYQAPQWITAWLHQLPASDTPVVIVVADEGGVSAALALARHRSEATSTLSALTPYAELNDLTGPGARRPHIAHALTTHLEQLVREGAGIDLTNVPGDSELAIALARRATWQASPARSALIPLPLVWDTLSPSLRRQHAKRERRLHAGHSITYARTRTTDDLLQMQPQLERLHAARWSQDGPARTPRPDWMTVLTELSHETAFIASIAIDGTLAAAQLCLHRGTTSWSLRPAMNPDFARLAPGHLLLRRLIDDLASHGFTGLDLGRTSESGGQIGYKDQYQPQWSTMLSFRPTPLQPTAVAEQLASALV